MTEAWAITAKRKIRENLKLYYKINIFSENFVYKFKNVTKSMHSLDNMIFAKMDYVGS